MTKVTMNLTERDIENTNDIVSATQSRSKAQAVSTALALTRFIINTMRDHPGTQIILRTPDGKTERLVMPELEKVAAAAVAAAS